MDNKLIDEYLTNKKELCKKTKSTKIITNFLLSAIFLLLSIILIKTNNKVENFFKNQVFKDTISFTKFNNFYNKYFGSLINNYLPKEEAVFNESISYSKIENYLNGKVLSVSDSYIIPVITSGIIVYLGDKDSLPNTCIIQGVDNKDIWYSNISLSNLNLYDYVEKGTPLAPTLSDKLYITIEDNGNYIDYETYQS